MYAEGNASASGGVFFIDMTQEIRVYMRRPWKRFVQVSSIMIAVSLLLCGITRFMDEQGRPTLAGAITACNCLLMAGWMLPSLLFLLKTYYKPPYIELTDTSLVLGSGADADRVVPYDKIESLKSFAKGYLRAEIEGDYPVVLAEERLGDSFESFTNELVLKCGKIPERHAVLQPNFFNDQEQDSDRWDD